MSATAPLSAVEGIKAASRRLRGTLVELPMRSRSIADPDTQLIKFRHTSRTTAILATSAGCKNSSRLPVHDPHAPARRRDHAQQWLKLDAIRPVMRTAPSPDDPSGVPVHGVIKRELKATMHALNAALIDTIAACGDQPQAGCRQLNRGRMQRCTKPRDNRLNTTPKTRVLRDLADEKQVAGSGEGTAGHGPLICRASSRSRLRCRRSTTSMRSRTTSASSPFWKAACWLASMS